MKRITDENNTLIKFKSIVIIIIMAPTEEVCGLSAKTFSGKQMFLRSPICEKDFMVRNV